MTKPLVRWCFAALLLAAPAAQAQDSKPRYMLDRNKTRVLQMSNLSPGTDCEPSKLAGRVVKREFDTSALLVKAVVIEMPDGSRTRAEIGVDLEPASMVDREWLLNGLQTLLLEGRRVQLGVVLCGAAGRVIKVDTIR
jgi:hypothetical protein